MSDWQNEERRCAVVLREVFGWLNARELACAGAACRAWRHAAAEPALWCRLLRPHQPHASAGVSWRQEYVWSHAGWSLHTRHRAADTLLHAALAPAAPPAFPSQLLALAGADASLAVWRREGSGGAWREAGRCCMRARGWGAVARAQWAGRGRLLLAGPLALTDDWELIVLSVKEDGRCGSVASRARCSAGAAGCWADASGDVFLSFELRRLGYALYCTTVWLNAATQETESEYAGVTSPLLRIFNEEGAHLTHALVAAAPREPPRDYQHALADTAPPPPPGARVLLAAAGCRLAAWPLAAPRPPPLRARAAGGLAERLQRLRRRRAQPEPEPPEPDEQTVRAACTPPEHCVRLPAPLVGLVLQEREKCMWAVCSDGSAACVSVAALQVLVWVSAGAAAPGAGLHYVQPAVDAAVVAWPAGGYAARVCVLAAASCARGRSLALGAPAVCCVLPRVGELLVLAADELYEWHSNATPQWDPRVNGCVLQE